LVRLLAGKDVSVAPYIGDLEEGLHGSASADDLETLFQLIYLVATAPRADAEGFAATQNMWTAYLENRLLDPRNVLYDTADRLLYGDNPRYRLPTREEVRTVNLQRAAAIYQERFADMDDFTFVFAGNLDLPMFKGLAQRYLGALPGLPGDESWRDRSLDPPAGVLEQKVFKGQEEQSIVNLTFTGAAEPSEENRTRIAVLRRLLNNLIVRELRETRGGVYSAGVWGYIEVEPKGRYTLGIEFSCAPDRVDELVSALFELITTLQEEGPTAADVARANQQAQSDQEEVLEQNGWWVDQILYYVTTSERSLDDLLAQNRTADIADAITLQAAARDFLPQDRYVKVVLYPETHAE
jgi:zinc protease